ncbi:MAG: ATP-binding protein [Eubacteriales bacterium]
MFFGREKEFQKLESLYASNQFEFVVFYGRRRVGKTTLITEFLKDKKAAYFMSIEGTKRENLRGLSLAILSLENSNVADALAFQEFEDLLSYVDQLARTGERIVIAIDEYPYLATSYPAISSMIQSHVDQCWKDSNLFLVLCGSSMSFMEEQVLGYKSPLYGRRTAQFKLRPFTFFESKEMYVNYSSEEQALLYGVTGGIPEYLSRVNPKLSVDENIIRLFFEESGRLFEEPSNLIKQELKEPASYHSIISAIASGASRMNEIATKTGLESSGCSSQITTLIALGIVKKEYPITDAPTSRKTIYRLQDSMFLFWYRFVRPNISNIMRGMGGMIYETQVKPQLNDFMGEVFEEMCQQYLYIPEVFVTLPFTLGNVGRWWGTNKAKKQQEEIDIMSCDNDNAFMCECKWRNEIQGVEVIETLLRRGEIFAYPNKYYCIFAKRGFTDAAIARAEEVSNLKLVSFDDIVAADNYRKK